MELEHGLRSFFRLESKNALNSNEKGQKDSKY